jgi:apolipoprotein N-acyltransferase
MDKRGKIFLIVCFSAFVSSLIIQTVFQRIVAGEMSVWGWNPGWQREIAFWNIGCAIIAIMSLRIKDTVSTIPISELTRQAAQNNAQIVVWPEIAIEGDPQVTNTAEFRQLAAETNAYLNLGYFVEVTDRLWRNETTVLSPDGQFLGIYGKDHPVTFAGETSATRGTYPVYETPLGRIGTIICYDLDFTTTARKITRNGAQLILVPSHDWPAIATKHYTHLVFRAIENRVSDGQGR